MIDFRIAQTKIQLSVWFFASLCIWTLFGGAKAALSAAFLLAHEFGHLAAMRAFGLRPAEIRVIAGRFEIRPAGCLLKSSEEVAVLCAGCAVNFLLAAFLRGMGQPELCYANLAFGLFNALPAGELDGGKILQIALENRLTPRTAGLVHAAVSFLVSIAVMCAGFLVLLRNALNPTVFLVGIYIFVSAIQNIRYTS